MRGPDFAVHNFKCPDCELQCQLIQDGRRASMRHQLPPCKTYLATMKDGQKFLELAFIAVPMDDKPDPVLVAFRDSGQPIEQEPGEPTATEPSAEHRAALEDARPRAADPTAAQAAELEAAAPKVTDSRASTDEHSQGCKCERCARARAPRRVPNPPRWQPLLEQLASELRAQIYDRAEVSRQLAQALIEAQPGATLVGFDDNRIAGLAQAIVNVCAASKGHP